MRDEKHIAVLVVEDNPDLAANLSDYLEARGYLVDVAMDGVTGLHLAITQPHDVIVLDVMLPGIDGLSVCRRLRRDARLTTPVLMLTARTTLDDKVAGFAEGADDYLTKPFELRELDLRLRALVKRTVSAAACPRSILVGDLSFDQDTLTVRRAGRAINLPAIPLRILELLITRSPHVVTRQEIERAIWGDAPPDSDALRVHLHTLRNAIDLPGRATLIHTLRGIGYQLKEGDAITA